ncbi:MAG TPA: hypothetical protein VH599_12680 [Ktedonobacterales bacterium]|jgi:hypothetical protein
MLGTLLIILLLASIVFLSAGFLMVALRMGKNFDQMSNQPPQSDQQRRRTGTRR